jgi:hypothetical protein
MLLSKNYRRSTTRRLRLQKKKEKEQSHMHKMHTQMNRGLDFHMSNRRKKAARRRMEGNQSPPST